jgi:hypothetical protein
MAISWIMQAQPTWHTFDAPCIATSPRFNNPILPYLCTAGEALCVARTEARKDVSLKELMLSVSRELRRKQVDPIKWNMQQKVKKGVDVTQNVSPNLKL